MKGNEAIAEAAIQAGAVNYFAYPITPQTEIAEYLAKRLPEIGGVFLQAESEVAAANMVYGAAATGVRVFTTSSSPGISLMAEAMSYIAGTELPCVFINIMRGGPGLGGILPSQADYFQATKGAGHGDYRMLVLAPASLQEAVDLVQDSFDLADKYRNPVMIVGDGVIGQMMEPVEFKPRPKVDLPAKDWALTGCEGRERRVLTSLYLDPLELEQCNHRLRARYDQMKREEIRFEEWHAEGEMDLLVVAYGTTSRICKSAIDMLEGSGKKIGLFRPISLFPFPEKQIADVAKRAKKILVVEMSMGQMIEDVQKAVCRDADISFYGRCGGIVPTPDEVTIAVKQLLSS